VSAFDSPEDVRVLLVQLSRSEAAVACAESALAFADARIRGLDASLAALKAVAYEVGVLRATVIVEPPKVLPPRIDDLSRAKARRALARSGFALVKP